MRRPLTPLALAVTMIATPVPAFAELPALGDRAERVTDGTRVVCRRMPPPSGSRLGVRNICRTQADWDLLQQENRLEVQRQQDASHYTNGS
ncbi:MAG: hypothetical protein H7X93_13325 [Sphingomonadaceae bacterium]|nr:hypothetical protein [Sphingomonadaceae bacterium]